MINNISEGTMRVASKIDPINVIHDKEINQQKFNEMREARPVEQSDAGSHAQSKDAHKKEEEGSSKYLVDEKQVVFEKYDKNGDLILRIPPSQKPVDHVA
jgi:hypothetical protein